MDELLKFINTRRSVRKFLDKSVEKEKILKILEAGMNAPSAGNEQPWHFVVVTDREKLLALKEKHPYAAMLAEAAAAIAVVADTNLLKYPGPGQEMWIQDLSAATENILLAIHTLGLGGVWLAVHPYEDREKEIAGILNIPAGYRILNLIALGYPNQTPDTTSRFQESRIHWEQW